MCRFQAGCSESGKSPWGEYIQWFPGHSEGTPLLVHLFNILQRYVRSIVMQCLFLL